MPQDRYAWSVQTARALRSGNLKSVNLIEVAEELEELGRSEPRELASRVKQIMEHLLKLRLVGGVKAQQNKRGWQASIIRQRSELQSLLEESPSLKRRLTPEFLEKCYRATAPAIGVEYNVKSPVECPFSLADILPENASLNRSRKARKTTQKARTHKGRTK
jgi:hypothetical protein